MQNFFNLLKNILKYIIYGIKLLYSFLIGVVLFLYFNMYMKS